MLSRGDSVSVPGDQGLPGQRRQACGGFVSQAISCRAAIVARAVPQQPRSASTAWLREGTNAVTTLASGIIAHRYGGTAFGAASFGWTLSHVAALLGAKMKQGGAAAPRSLPPW